MAWFDKFFNWRKKKPAPEPQTPQPPQATPQPPVEPALPFGVGLSDQGRDEVFFGEEIYVGSTNVLSFRYDATTQDLFVKFLNGSEYRYLGVELATAYKCVGSDSPGRAVHNYLVGKYVYERIAEPTRKKWKPNVLKNIN